MKLEEIKKYANYILKKQQQYARLEEEQEFIIFKKFLEEQGHNAIYDSETKNVNIIFNF